METKGQTPDGPANGAGDHRNVPGGSADREEWLKGPVAGIPALLQPVAHALLQVRKELTPLMDGFPDELLWERPGGVASVGFHLQHLTGVLDRLFTYAKGESLSAAQLGALKGEGASPENVTTPLTLQLVGLFNRQVDLALAELASTNPDTLTEPREVGRARIPSTVIGLLVHAAEHTTRHFGQLLVTVKVIGR
jgi:hypothetical protein